MQQSAVIEDTTTRVGTLNGPKYGLHTTFSIDDHCRTLVIIDENDNQPLIICPEDCEPFGKKISQEDSADREIASRRESVVFILLH